MQASVLEIFSVGLGPSSSHTVGPMRAGYAFSEQLKERKLLDRVSRISVDCFGSLAATGAGHGTFGAILLGLEGEEVAEIDPSYAHQRIAEINEGKKLRLCGTKEIVFHAEMIGKFPYTIKQRHPNALTITATDGSGLQLFSDEYYSIGGGFIESNSQPLTKESTPVPYPFKNTQELLAHCTQLDCAIKDVVWLNETAIRSETEVRTGILTRWKVMSGCIERGLRTPGVLPGKLEVQRRAPDLYKRLTDQIKNGEPTDEIDWLNLAAMAVNEENAAGGKIVTAPTNGAAGIFPAVLYYALRASSFPSPKQRDNVIVNFFLTATAIAQVIKAQASVSGAEVGCQGEVGSACALAAAGYAALRGGSNTQIENAAEIAIEHNLGLTCDPIGGLVQIPCIERNAIGAVKAINAARLASYGDGSHRVSLDDAIITMRETGKDMLSKYKETSLGGLAVNVLGVNIIEC